MQHVTVTMMSLELYLNQDCAFANASLHCYSQCICGSSVIFSLYLQQYINYGLNLPLTERQCLDHAKQGAYAIKSHDNLRQKASVVFFFFSLKVVEATFCVGVKNKTSN